MKNNRTKNQGFTLLIAAIITGMFLVVSFAVLNIAVKQLILSDAGEESQHAFYNADSGMECATYWDLKNTNSPFDPYVNTPYSPTPKCNNQNLTFLTTTPPPISGGYSTSTIKFNTSRGYVQVDIVKKVGAATTTKIDSRGYNSASGSSRRVERGVTLTY